MKARPKPRRYREYDYEFSDRQRQPISDYAAMYAELNTRIPVATNPPAYTVPITAPVDASYSSVVLLSRFNTEAGGPSSTDDKGKVLTFVGNAQVSNSQSKFGGWSLLLDGTGDYVTTPDSDDWHFGGSPFTIELFVRHAAGFSTNEAYLAAWGATVGEQSWAVWLNTGQLQFRVQTSSGQVNVSAAWTPVLNAWYHIAVDRDLTGKIRLYRDGSMVASQVLDPSVTFTNGTGLLGYGRIPGFSTYDLQGWLDSVRITKGVARYGSDSGYTVLTVDYPVT